MTRSITAVWTVALCAIAVAVAQPAALANGQTTSTKAKAPATTSAPATTKAPATTSAPAKPSTPAKTSAPAKASTPAKTTAPAQRASASLTGCLHADGDKLMLSDLEGKQVPKGRSWKTAYIVKTDKDVEVDGTSSTVNLTAQIGHRVTITGTRDGERHFKAQSVKQVSQSCS